MKNVFPFKRSDDYFCLILWLEMQFAVCLGTFRCLEYCTVTPEHGCTPKYNINC